MHLNAINPGHREGEMRLQHTHDNYRFITTKTFTHLDHLKRFFQRSGIINQAITLHNDGSTVLCGQLLMSIMAAIKEEICQMSMNNEQTVLLKVINTCEVHHCAACLAI